jgi:hypothetical protein
MMVTYGKSVPKPMPPDTKSPREKDIMPLPSMRIEHTSKSRKLNGVGKIFLVLFDLLFTLWLMMLRLVSLFNAMSLNNEEFLIIGS